MRSMFLSLAAIVGAIAIAPAARADDKGCVLKGTFPAAKGTTIHDAASGGRAIAAFTGSPQAIVLSDFPSDLSAGRARIATSHGGGSLRIDGFVAASQIAVFTTREVPIAPDHVWIAEGQRVRLVGATSGSLSGEIAVPGTHGQTARATGPCDAWSLDPRPTIAASVPGDARGFVTRGVTIELFESPGGAVVFTLRPSEGTAQLFWSTESRAGFVHVRARGALVIDAWARSRDLEALKKGEMMDQFVPPTTTAGGATLKLDGEPRVVRVSRDVAIRARRDDKEKPIGVIESGAEVLVIETMLGFTNVLPKSLGLMPAEDGGFWVPTADLKP